MENDLQENYIELSNFLIRKDFYREQYRKALSQELYDFLVILAWKTFILFAYEKIQQSRHIVGDDNFKQDFWEKGSLISKKYDLSNYPVDNVFCYNELDDEQVIDLLKRTYEFDENFSKKLKVLRTNRNTAAHVAEETLTATATQVSNMLDLLLKAVKCIDNKYKNKFLSTTEFDRDNWSRISFSESDFKFILNTKILPGLKAARTFEVATKIMKFIEGCADYLDIQSVEKILIASLENGDPYNQVIDANYGYIFFNFLLEKTYKLKGDFCKWKEFYDQLNSNRQTKYSNIKESLKKQGVDFGEPLGEEEINLDDIPF